MKQCLECKSEFEPKSELAIFCSGKCRQKKYRKNIRELLKEARNGKTIIEKVEPIVSKTLGVSVSLQEKLEQLKQEKKGKPQTNEPENRSYFDLRKKKLGW